MEQLKAIIQQLSSQQRRYITLIMAFLVTYSGTFIRSLSIQESYRSYSGWMSEHDIVDTMLSDGGVSIGDMFCLSLEHGEILIWLGATAAIVGFWAALFLTFKAINDNASDIPMIMVIVSLVAAVYSFLLLFSSYGNYVNFSFHHFFRILLALLMAGFWRLSCEVESLPPSGLGGTMGDFGKSKDPSCPHCHKVLSAKAQFCNGCGQPVSFGTSGCKSCHAPLAAGAQFCPKCGAKTE